MTRLLALLLAFLPGLALAEDRPCIAPEAVIRIEQEAVPGLDIRRLDRMGTEALIAAAKKDGAPESLTGDSALVFTDPGLPFALIVLFEKGCAGTYGKMPVYLVNRWLGDAI